jgi:hypothetical protein
MFRNVILRLIGAVLFVTISQSGCSVVGFGTGALIDASWPDSVIFSGGQMTKAKMNRKTIIHLDNGEILEGKLVRIQRRSTEEYSDKYNEYCERVSDSMYLPHYGDTVDIVLTSGMALERRFIGFDYQFGKVSFSNKNVLPNYVAVGFLNDHLTGKIYLSEIEKIVSSDGAFVERSVIDDLMLENEIPTYSSAIFELPANRRTIALDEINRFVMHNGNNLKYYGLVMGAAVDMAALLFVSGAAWTWNGSSF